jgi:hypothetical protein
MEAPLLIVKIKYKMKIHISFRHSGSFTVYCNLVLCYTIGVSRVRKNRSEPRRTNMIIKEFTEGKVLVNGNLLDLTEYTRSLAALFDLNQATLNTVDGKEYTLWFNSKSMVIKELVPAEAMGAIRKEFITN